METTRSPPPALSFVDRQRPASASATVRHNPRQHLAITKEDPWQWDRTVVHALCTRLPGGISPVTKPCSSCHSVFYPCLCESHPKGEGLRAPKVVRAAEECRLATTRAPPRAGSLFSVYSVADRHDMDTDRLVVMGDEGMGILRRNLETARVLDRDAAHYLVVKDGAGYKQKLSFTWQELEQLERCLEEYEDGSLVVTEPVKSKMVTVRYNTRAEAVGDVELVPFRFESRENGNVQVPLVWHARLVKAGGLAGAMSVGAGHVLSSLEVLSCDKGTWSVRRPPACLWAPEQPGASDEPEDDAAFPCQLTFERLPVGTHVIAEEPSGGTAPPELSLRRLSELASVRAGATLAFERREFVSRDDVICRHEHPWEKRQEYTQLDDESLLRTWTFGAHLTLASLSFVFKKLVELITEEMHRFERAKGLRMRLILDKCRKCVSLKREFELPAKRADPAQAKAALRYATGEVHNIFQAVPAYFLEEIAAEYLNRANAHRRPSVIKHGSTQMQLANEMAHREFDKAEPEVVAFLSEQVNVFLADIGQQGCTSPSNPRSLRAISRRNLSSSVQRDPAEERIKKAVSKLNHGTPLLADEDLDGKISEKEFERLVIMAGFTWLTRSQQKQMFHVLDKNDSGKLNLGEILSAAARIMELISRATVWAKEHERERKRVGGKPIAEKEVLKEFWKQVLCQGPERTLKPCSPP